MQKFKQLFGSSKLKRMLSITLFVAGVVLLLYPFAPAVKFFLQHQIGKGPTIPYVTRLDVKDFSKEDVFVETIPAPIPEENRLVIPSIGVDVEIVEGNGDWVLSKGSWHRPGTGDPVAGGNFVLTGHRFQYLPPNNTTFYNLDKLVVGDIVIVYWGGVEYDYKISEDGFVVGAEQVEIEADLGYDVLTLYTCTPLWTSERRLVYRATPMNVEWDNILED